MAMRSIWGLYKSAKSQDDDDAAITGLTSSLTTLTSKVNTVYGSVLGSLNMKVVNVASAPTTIPGAGIIQFDTTRKVIIYSDGTSMFLATTGSCA